MDVRRVATVALAVALVAAGCAGPAATGTDTETGTGPSASVTATPAGTATADVATTSPRASSTPGETSTGTATPAVPAGAVEVRGGEFSFDPAVVYARVVRMHGLAMEEAPNVTVYVRDRSSVSLRDVYDPSPFERTMGIEPVAEDTAIAGLASGNRVYVYVGVVADPAEREATLAHEYAHVVQTAREHRQTVYANVEGSETERVRVATGLIEGAATYVENRYRVRYMDAPAERLDWNESRADRSAFGAFLVAPYVFGHRYVRRAVDSVRELDRVYENPPQTTEQLLHGADTEAEPPRPLSVTADTEGWRHGGVRTKGELFVRLVLERQVAPARAARAAAGWGNDEVLSFVDDGAAGFAWVLRWDDAGEADEFAAALRAYLDARGDRTDGHWTDGDDAFRVVRPDDETVALLAGDESFVRAASVSGSDGGYVVQVDGETGAAAGTAGEGSAAATATVGPVPTDAGPGLAAPFRNVHSRTAVRTT